MPTIAIKETLLADLETPVTAYLKLSEHTEVSFLLESVEAGRRWSRYSFIGVGANRVFRLKNGRMTINGEETLTDNPLGTLYRAINRRVEGEPRLPFWGGAVGYVAYDLARSYERLPSENPDDLNLPELLFIEPRVVAVFDHFKQQLHLVAAAEASTAGAVESARERVLEAKRRLLGPLPGVAGTRAGGRTPFTPNMSKADYEEAVQRAVAYIRAGDIFQVVPSLRLSAPLRVHPFALYRALRSVNPSPYMGYLDLGEVTLVSGSPESLLRSEPGGRVVTRPIAGTRPRGKNTAEDTELAAELLASEKERAEHVMLLDLSRNDLGRVSRFGSVRVTEQLVVEQYSHVMHLVSTVEGHLAEGKTPLDALASVLPMGTVSGAPKIRAMEIIEELEPYRRGPYGGAFGYLGYDGQMDMALTLRTFVIANGRVHVQAGAGVVADSRPQSEYQECLNKAQALLKAARMAEEGLE